jgi:hypothetical protein
MAERVDDLAFPLTPEGVGERADDVGSALDGAGP